MSDEDVLGTTSTGSQSALTPAVQSPISAGPKLMSDADVLSAGNRDQGDKNQPQKSAQDTLPQLQPLPNESTGQEFIRKTVNSITPYVMDSSPDMSAGQRAADAVKGAVSGVGQTAVGAITGPIDIAHNVGEYAGNKLGRAITGTETQPQYSDYTGSAFNKLGLNYQPKTASGNIAQAEGQFLGPSAISKIGEGVAASGTTAGRTGSTLWAGIKAPDPETLQDLAAQGKADAGDIFNQMRTNGAIYGPDKTEAIRDAVNEAVQNPSFVPEMNPKTLGIVRKINQVADSGQMSLGDLHNYRTLLSRVGNSEDGVSAGSVKKAINEQVYAPTSPDDLVAGTPEAANLLKQGTAAYARASRVEDISDILAGANGDPNRIKQRLQAFVKNKDNLVGYNEDEKAALRNAANTSTGENILKAFGKLGFDFSRSGTGNTVLPALIAGEGIAAPLAGIHSGGYGIPLVAAGTLARQGQKYMARGKAQQALDLIANRPLPERIPAAETSGAPYSGPMYGGSLNNDLQLTYQPKQAKGGRVARAHSGRVFKKPKSYPALKDKHA